MLLTLLFAAYLIFGPSAHFLCLFGPIHNFDQSNNFDYPTASINFKEIKQMKSYQTY